VWSWEGKGCPTRQRGDPLEYFSSLTCTPIPTRLLGSCLFGDRLPASHLQYIPGEHKSSGGDIALKILDSDGFT
jgi:hypothetical protein